MNEPDLEHDIAHGLLNGITFNLDAGEDPLFIQPISCERCGAPVFLGVIVSTCGDTEKNVWEENKEIDGFSRHDCANIEGVHQQLPDCPVCFSEEEDLDDMDMTSVAR